MTIHEIKSELLKLSNSDRERIILEVQNIESEMQRSSLCQDSRRELLNNRQGVCPHCGDNKYVKFGFKSHNHLNEFGTSTHETMQVIEGEMIVKLPNSSEWTTYKAGESYNIDANESFQVKVLAQTSYLCTYK